MENRESTPLPLRRGAQHLGYGAGSHMVMPDFKGGDICPLVYLEDWGNP